MSAARIGAEVRRLVAERARGLCEYCLIAEEDTFFGCEVDHIISLKHGGLTREDNLAYACAFCNRNKGSDIASLVPQTGAIVRLYNPRTDRWLDHFKLDVDGVTILPLTEVGEATLRVLGINAEDRLLERRALRDLGRFPGQATRNAAPRPD